MTLLHPASLFQSELGVPSGDAWAQRANSKFESAPDNSFWRNVFQQVDAHLAQSDAALSQPSAGQSAGGVGDQPAAESADWQAALRFTTGDPAALPTRPLAVAPDQIVGRPTQHEQVAGDAVSSQAAPGPRFAPSRAVANEDAALESTTQLRRTRDLPSNFYRWNPIHATLAATSEGQWKLYVRGAGLGLSQALDASRAALAEVPGEPGRIVEITINGQIAYQDQRSAPMCADAHRTDVATGLNWSA